MRTPHNPVKSAMLARYVKNFLYDAGIDITIFTAHSTRAASTSKLNNLGLSMKDIFKAAGWRNSVYSYAYIVRKWITRSLKNIFNVQYFRRPQSAIDWEPVIFQPSETEI